MNYANLKILNIELPIGANKYHDDGFVKSMPMHEKKLNRHYGFFAHQREAEKNIGLCASYFKGKGISNFYPVVDHHHIFYLKQSNDVLDILLRAHEETHALDKLGGLDILSEKLLQEQRVKINFKQIDEEEVRAELGAMYALNSRKNSVSEKWFAYMFSDRDTNAARKIYKQSKLPERKFFLF
jgi:hypothetical protein